MVLLQTLDHLWREHLVTLEHLRQVIGFRAYGQRDPLNEYKSEAFVLFESMLGRLREATTGQLMHVELAPPGEQPRSAAGGIAGDAAPIISIRPRASTSSRTNCAMVDAAIAAKGRGVPRAGEAARRFKPAGPRARSIPIDPATWGKVSRNALCPCGSGKKYKHCHGKYE